MPIAYSSNFLNAFHPYFEEENKLLFDKYSACIEYPANTGGEISCSGVEGWKNHEWAAILMIWKDYIKIK